MIIKFIFSLKIKVQPGQAVRNLHKNLAKIVNKICDAKLRQNYWD